MNMEYTMSFNQAQKCLSFIDNYKQFYTRHWVNFAGTVFETLFKLMDSFEKVITSGVVNHPSNAGYSSGINTLLQVQKAVHAILTSNYVFTDYTIKYALQDIHNILTPSLNNYDGKVIRDGQSGKLYKIENGRALMYSWDNVRNDGGPKFITVTNPVVLREIRVIQ
jgi:hypothetical protein